MAKQRTRGAGAATLQRSPQLTLVHSAGRGPGIKTKGVTTILNFPGVLLVVILLLSSTKISQWCINS